ncbi:putative lipid II flippase FtsW [Granulosicoccus sp.]|nr:putative lipid II flippase FtsW [Granulosicoccus sp.]MDB4222817.1 putative lipid II flippase FtsW [Granulosicoccus sp.]
MSSLVSRVATGRSPASVQLASPITSDRFSDHALLIAILVLGLFGAAMIGSASMPFAAKYYGNPFHFLTRQLIFLGIGCVFGILTFRLPLAVWEKYGPHLIITSLVFLVLVLIPGIGKEVNGSRRWIDIGLFTIQVSETVKLFVIVYLAGYLVRRGYLVQTTFGGFVRPLGLICAAGALLLLEPDFGAAVVIVATSVIMILVAGVRFSQFMAILTVLGSVGTVLILTSPYRLRRFSGFLDPFADQYGSGYQLSNSLIAIGGGGLTGSGFGNSIQKMFYLPESHTDFLFAVLCEELGMLGALFLIFLYSFIVWRCFRLAKIADQQNNRFAGFLALGIGSWIGLQSFINMGVNLGILPTKGITLPLMSYGGSSAVVFGVAFSLLLRVEWELRQNAHISLHARARKMSGGGA